MGKFKSEQRQDCFVAYYYKPEGQAAKKQGVRTLEFEHVGDAELYAVVAMFVDCSVFWEVDCLVNSGTKLSFKCFPLISQQYVKNSFVMLLMSNMLCFSLIIVTLYVITAIINLQL